MSNNRLIRSLLVPLALSLLHPSMTVAASVVDTSAPTALAAPTATEFANAEDLIANGFGVVPGSVVIAIRSAPSTQINPGLDAPEPGLDDGADTLEVAVVPLPLPSVSCPANTPVTVTVSAWTKTLAGASPSPVGAGGGGGGLMDSRDLSPTAPATMATVSGASNPSTIGGTNGSPQTQYIGIYADLPFLTYFTTINAVRRSSGVAVQSHYEIQVPSITVEYDDATCTAISMRPPKAVPAMPLAQLFLLCVAMLIIGTVGSLGRKVWL